MFVCCECCVLSGRGLRRADHSPRGDLPTVMRRCVCDLETSRMRRPWPALGRSATGEGIWPMRRADNLTTLMCRLS